MGTLSSNKDKPFSSSSENHFADKLLIMRTPNNRWPAKAWQFLGILVQSATSPRPARVGIERYSRKFRFEISSERTAKSAEVTRNGRTKLESLEKSAISLEIWWTTCAQSSKSWGNGRFSRQHPTISLLLHIVIGRTSTKEPKSDIEKHHERASSIAMLRFLSMSGNSLNAGLRSPHTKFTR